MRKLFWGSPKGRHGINRLNAIKEKRKKKLPSMVGIEERLNCL